MAVTILAQRDKMWVTLGPESLPEPAPREEQAEHSRYTSCLPGLQPSQRAFIGPGTGYNRRESGEDGGVDGVGQQGLCFHAPV